MLRHFVKLSVVEEVLIDVFSFIYLKNLQKWASVARNKEWSRLLHKNDEKFKLILETRHFVLRIGWPEKLGILIF